MRRIQVLIAIPVTLMLTVADLRPVLARDAEMLNGGSAVSRTPSPSVEIFTPAPPPDGPFRQAPANALVAVSFVYCFGVIMLSLESGVKASL
jgi:hypothetical protein